MPKGNTSRVSKINRDNRDFLFINGLIWDFTELVIEWYIIEKGEQYTNKKNFTTSLGKLLQ
ncbi:hypothetical protein AML91_10830 [Paenibacillus jilunlii]|uniref:Uncharacterized protein n=1 Tax=Paenibacillus jilunlii TaxID=682956 RepID=A0ABR5SVM2_9BACL|nr:hypothetical protein AML91_10830 [Paenibacillus jilunlii]